MFYFRCGKCDYSTTTKYHLDAHAKSCSGEKKALSKQGQENKVSTPKDQQENKVDKIKSPNLVRIKIENDSEGVKTRGVPSPVIKSHWSRRRGKLRVKINNSEQNSLKCKQCPIVALTLSKLEFHVKSVHENRKCCLQCPFSAKTAEELMKHVLIHVKSENVNAN